MLALKKILLGFAIFATALGFSVAPALAADDETHNVRGEWGTSRQAQESAGAPQVRSWEDAISVDGNKACTSGVMVPFDGDQGDYSNQDPLTQRGSWLFACE